MSSGDRRTTERQSLPIEIEFWCDSTRHRGRIEDLSEGGAYVYTGLNWPSGKTIEFSFSIPGADAPITGTGTLVWSEFMGFGLRFDSLDDAARRSIHEVVGAQPAAADRRGSDFAQRLEAASG